MLRIATNFRIVGRGRHRGQTGHQKRAGLTAYFIDIINDPQRCQFINHPLLSCYENQKQGIGKAADPLSHY